MAGKLRRTNGIFHPSYIDVVMAALMGAVLLMVQYSTDKRRFIDAMGLSQLMYARILLAATGVAMHLWMSCIINNAILIHLPLFFSRAFVIALYAGLGLLCIGQTENQRSAGVALVLVWFALLHVNLWFVRKYKCDKTSCLSGMRTWRHAVLFVFQCSLLAATCGMALVQVVLRDEHDMYSQLAVIFFVAFLLCFAMFVGMVDKRGVVIEEELSCATRVPLGTISRLWSIIRRRRDTQ